jgi:hypothetical protein
MPNLLSQVDAKMSEFSEAVKEELPKWEGVRDGVGLRSMETDLAALARKLADGIAGAILQALVGSSSLQAETRASAGGPEKVRSGGKRKVHVRLLGGSVVRLDHVPYVKADRRGRPGRRRGTGRRGKAGAGFYPLLAALGIAWGITPALAGEICRQVADSDSVRAGRQALDRRGIDLGHKQTLRIVNQFSQRAVAQRNALLENATAAPPQSGLLKGQRVVITTDGGRLRERLAHGRGRRRRATGHRRYDAPWREPKLIVLYVIDDKGKVLRKTRPIYDGTLGTCDDTFAMLMGYLRMLGAHEAKQLLLLGDGAKWIWARAAELAAGVGLDASKLVEVVDWCHAVSVLHVIADVPRQWTHMTRDSWIRRAKNLLHAGRTDDLVAHIQTLAVGRNAPLVTKHCDYFLRNAARMQYASFGKAHVPIGSGAVESAVRRVVNMRMKSNGMFWLEINAEGMLLLRSYLKAGRFDDLVDWSIARAASWWTTAPAPQLCAA